MILINPQPKLEQVALLGNLPTLHCSGATGRVVVTLLRDDDGLRRELAYTPDAKGRFAIDLRPILSPLVRTPNPVNGAAGESDLERFRLRIDGHPEYLFYVVDGGVATASEGLDHEHFLRTNWLTWQPADLECRWDQPQWLGLASVDANQRVMLRAYYSDGGVEEREWLRTSENTLLLLNTSPEVLCANEPDRTRLPGAWDVWVADHKGERLTYVQRYRLAHSNNLGEEDLFLFRNSLGGWDTLLLDGAKQAVDSIESSLAELESDAEVGVSYTRSYAKKSGYFGSEEVRSRLMELFKSEERFHRSEHYVWEPIRIEPGEHRTEYFTPNRVEFRFWHSQRDNRGFLNLHRTPPAEQPPLQLVTPDGVAFPLAPRLTELPTVDLGATIYLPAQHAGEELWRRVSLEELVGAIPKAPAILSLLASPGANFYREGQPYNASLLALLYRENVEITHDVHPSGWVWERSSENPAGDGAWNLHHRNIGNTLRLTEADIVGDTLICLSVYDHHGAQLTQLSINF